MKHNPKTGICHNCGRAYTPATELGELGEHDRLSVGKFARWVGVSVTTLQRWDRARRLVADRTTTGRRVYGRDHLRQVISEHRTA